MIILKRGLTGNEQAQVFERRILKYLHFLTRHAKEHGKTCHACNCQYIPEMQDFDIKIDSYRVVVYYKCPWCHSKTNTSYQDMYFSVDEEEYVKTAVRRLKKLQRANKRAEKRIKRM